MAFDCVANRLNASIETLRDSAVNVGRTRPGSGQPTCPGNDVLVLGCCELGKPTATLNPHRIRLDKLVDIAAQKSHPITTANIVPTSHKTTVAPARDCFGGNAEALGKFFYGKNFAAVRFPRWIGTRSIFQLRHGCLINWPRVLTVAAIAAERRSLFNLLSQTVPVQMNQRTRRN